MINAFGCGFSEGYGNDFDISKLRYDKIIIIITDPVSALLDIAKQKHCGDTDNTDILTNTESA